MMKPFQARWPFGPWRQEEVTRLELSWPAPLVRAVLGPYARHVQDAELVERRIFVWEKRHPWSLKRGYPKRESTFTVTLKDGRREVLDISHVRIAHYERVVRAWLGELLQK
jgi:hypothetical protein